MRVLLSGATGLIGKAVGEVLASQGHEVTALTRNPSRAAKALGFPCKVREWADPSKAPALDDDDQFDTVIHLAGEPIADRRWSPEQKLKIRDSRVTGTRVLGESLRNRGVRVWIQGSAIGYYGSAGDHWLDETSLPGNDFLSEVVRDWEKSAEYVSKELGARLTVIRIGMVLSISGGALPKLLKVFRAGVGGRLGNGKQYMSWVHIDDLVNLILFSATREDLPKVLNAVAPTPVTNSEFTAAIAKFTSRCEFVPTPAFALKIALGELSTVLLSSQRVRSSAEDYGFKFRFRTLDEALSNFQVRKK